MAKRSTQTRCSGRSFAAPVAQPIRNSPAGITIISGSKFTDIYSSDCYFIAAFAFAVLLMRAAIIRTNLGIRERLPAVRLHRSPYSNTASAFGIVGGFQEVFEVIHRQVQVVVVHVSAINMNLAHQVMADLRPVLFEVVAQS
jgi:hypothetical protein